MPKPIDWTPEMQARLRIAVIGGSTLEQCAAAFGFSCEAITAQLDRMGLRVRGARKCGAIAVALVGITEREPEADERDEWPDRIMPARHPISVGAIENFRMPA
jgi:hypothetical protein